MIDTVPLLIKLPSMSVTSNVTTAKSPAVPLMTSSHGVNMIGAGLTITGTVVYTLSVPLSKTALAITIPGVFGNVIFSWPDPLVTLIVYVF